jgi:hypothetical protein
MEQRPCSLWAMQYHLPKREMIAFGAQDGQDCCTCRDSNDRRFSRAEHFSLPVFPGQIQSEVEIFVVRQSECRGHFLFFWHYYRNNNQFEEKTLVRYMPA